MIVVRLHILALVLTPLESSRRPNAQRNIAWNDRMHGYALANHVLQRFEGQSDVSLCGIRCLNAPNCTSFNTYHNRPLCELSSSDRFSSPDDVMRDNGAEYSGLYFDSFPTCYDSAGRKLETGSSAAEVCDLEGKVTHGSWNEWSEWGRWCVMNVTHDVRYSSRECVGPFHAGYACEGETTRLEYIGKAEVPCEITGDSLVICIDEDFTNMVQYKYPIANGFNQTKYLSRAGVQMTGWRGWIYVFSYFVRTSEAPGFEKVDLVKNQGAHYESYIRLTGREVPSGHYMASYYVCTDNYYCAGFTRVCNCNTNIGTFVTSASTCPEGSEEINQFYIGLQGGSIW